MKNCNSCQHWESRDRKTGVCRKATDNWRRQSAPKAAAWIDSEYGADAGLWTAAKHFCSMYKHTTVKIETIKEMP